MAERRREDIAWFVDRVEIGTGAFSRVYKAWDQRTNTWIAMKRIRLPEDGSGIPSALMREVGLMKKLKSQYIVDLRDIVLVPPTHVYLILDYLALDLRCLLSSSPEKVTTDFARSALLQILRGVDFCHSRRIMHRDLKPENILLTADLRIKIADFGLARLFQLPLRPLSAAVQTLHYRAPEVLLGCKEYTFAVDIWSIGCIFVELLTHKRLFEGYNDLSQLVEIARLLGPPPSNLCPESVRGRLTVANSRSLQTLLSYVSNDCLDLVESMLRYDPCERITAREALAHPFFYGINSDP